MAAWLAVRIPTALAEVWLKEIYSFNELLQLFTHTLGSFEAMQKMRAVQSKHAWQFNHFYSYGI